MDKILSGLNAPFWVDNGLVTAKKGQVFKIHFTDVMKIQTGEEREHLVTELQ